MVIKCSFISSRLTGDLLLSERSEGNNILRVNRDEIKALLIRNFIFIFTLLILKRVLTIYYHEIQ